MRPTLCKNCLSRNPSYPGAVRAASESQCAMCLGSHARIPSLAKSIKSADFEWESFFFSSSVPADWLALEERGWDLLPWGRWQSLKNELNRRSVLAVSNLGKRHAARNADAEVHFDFGSNTARASPLPLFIFARYCKRSRSFSQSIWTCGKCRGKGCAECANRGERFESIESIMSDAARRAFKSAGARLHASGREDIDVLMLGGGRPFVLEILSPKLRESAIPDFVKLVNASGSVTIAGSAKKVGFEWVEIVCNSHFEKEYSALVCADRPLGQSDCQSLLGRGFRLMQQTPSRVLARRPDLVRIRAIRILGAAPLDKGQIRLHLLADAGTYIKEFIHSDSGRTSPNISTLLSCKAECKELNVVRIHDGFLETCGA